MEAKQPEALKVADWLEIHSNGPVDNKRWAAALLRTQHAEIERKDALLRQCWEALHVSAASSKVQREALDAITRELSA